MALVTGASSGIGARCSRALAGAGAKIALTAPRTDRIEALRDEIEGGRQQIASFPRQCAMTDQELDSALLYFAGDASRAVTGTELIVDDPIYHSRIS